VIEVYLEGEPVYRVRYRVFFGKRAGTHVIG